MAKRVLIVDDEAEMVSLVQYGLESAGYEVSTCDNGRQVLSAIEKFKPDLLLLDVMLPGMDGFSLQTKISQDEKLKKLPVIILSALEPSRALFQKFPQVAAFISKPFDCAKLLENVKKIFEEGK
jgi:DNA-binding response OmpR family regulator